jgi:hypothetical protein
MVAARAITCTCDLSLVTRRFMSLLARVPAVSAALHRGTR